MVLEVKHGFLLWVKKAVYVFREIQGVTLDVTYRGADKSLAPPGRKQANVCQNGVNFLRRLALQETKNLMTACVSMLLKSRASPTCFRACFLPGRA